MAGVRKGHGGHGFNEGDGGDSQQRLPPSFPPNQLARSPYSGFQNPPAFDSAKGHNFPLALDKFRVGLFRVMSQDVLDEEQKPEENDYLRCVGYDPNLKRRMQIAVAKPYLLQRTPFDEKVLVLKDSIITFDYETDEPNFRKASGFVGAPGLVEEQGLSMGLVRGEGADEKIQELRSLIDSVRAAIEDGEENELSEYFFEEYQRITEDYYPGDYLVSIHAETIPNLDSTDWKTDDGFLLAYVDLNVSGRAWAVTDEEVQD